MKTPSLVFRESEGEATVREPPAMPIVTCSRAARRSWFAPRWRRGGEGRAGTEIAKGEGTKETKGRKWKRTPEITAKNTESAERGKGSIYPPNQRGRKVVKAGR